LGVTYFAPNKVKQNCQMDCNVICVYFVYAVCMVSAPIGMWHNIF
jgi:hypothetical protein